jgi:hypothetical protein
MKTERLRTAIPKAAKLTSITADPPTMVKPMASMVVMVRSGACWCGRLLPFALSAVLCCAGTGPQKTSSGLLTCLPPSIPFTYTFIVEIKENNPR